MRDVTDSTFDAEVEQNSKLVLVDFWAPWCGPCHQMRPMLDQLAEDHQADWDMFALNVDENPEVVGRLKVLSLPTLMAFRDGAPVGRTTGTRSRQQLEELMAEASASSGPSSHD